jgi:hypothetical protein
MATIGTKRRIRRIWCCRSTFLTLFNLFICFNSKKHVLTVSHMIVTLGMMSNSLRSSPVINAHLPRDQAGISYCSDRKKVWKNGGNHPVSNITPEFFIQGVTYILKNESYMYSTNRRELSVTVTYNLQSNCQMRNCQSTHFSMKMASKRNKNMLWQPYILVI